jgi:hypothetical protein
MLVFWGGLPLASKGISLQLERDGMKWVRDRQQVWVDISLHLVNG